LEFPFPDEHHRELLWRGIFPRQTLLAEDLDFTFLGRQFPLSGGNIKNAALAAAFLAAAEDSTVQMRHLIASTDFQHRIVVCGRPMAWILQLPAVTAEKADSIPSRLRSCQTQFAR
jgi:hypothetical protein